MIPHTCTVKHDPPNSYGDCLRAAVASLLNYPDAALVPHFYEFGDDERGNEEFKHWLLQTHNLQPFYMALNGTTPLADLFAMMAGVNTDIEYLLFCKCGDADHVVVCKNDKVIHDPAWYRSPITEPTSNGFWVVVVLVPLYL